MSCTGKSRNTQSFWSSLLYHHTISCNTIGLKLSWEWCANQSSISISEGSISKRLLSQLTPTNAILPSHTRWGISSSLKQIQDILWFFKVPSKHAFCEPETWKIHFVSTLTFPGFFLAMSLPFPPSRLPIWAKLEVTSTEGKISRKKLKMLDRDRAGGFVPFASGFERAHLISLLDVQVWMLEIYWHMWLQSNSIQTQYQILGILWTSQNYLVNGSIDK